MLLNKLLWFNYKNHAVSHFRHKLIYYSIPCWQSFYFRLLFEMTVSITICPIQMRGKIITPSLISECYSSQELKGITIPRARALALGSFTSLFLTQVKFGSQKMKIQNVHKCFGWCFNLLKLCKRNLIHRLMLKSSCAF